MPASKTGKRRMAIWRQLIPSGVVFGVGRLAVGQSEGYGWTAECDNHAGGEMRESYYQWLEDTVGMSQGYTHIIFDIRSDHLPRQSSKSGAISFSYRS